MSTEGARLERFKLWLAQHGARYPKIVWPSVDTIGGCRGAQASDDIQSGEHMLEIPVKLMMSPPLAFQGAPLSNRTPPTSSGAELTN
jgi:hypothetical protein